MQPTGLPDSDIIASIAGWWRVEKQRVAKRPVERATTVLPEKKDIDEMRRWISSLKTELALGADRRRIVDRARWGADAGDLARQVFDWDAAIGHYRRYLDRRPRDLGVALRLASVLDSSGRIEEAEALLRDLVRRRPDSAAARKSLARTMGESAVPGFQMDSVQRRYQTFRESLVLPEAPEQTAGVVSVVMDGRGIQPAIVRASLIALKAQTLVTWTALVVVEPDMLSHPLASLGRVDARIRFASAFPSGPAPDETPSLFMQAGVMLEPPALAWFIHAASTTGAALIYADHDRSADHWRWGRAWFDPALFPAPHPEDFTTNERPPLAVLVTGSALAKALSDPCGACTPDGRRSLLQACSGTDLVHVPLLLASLLEAVVVDDSFEIASEESRDLAPAFVSVREPVGLEADDTILVVIPTRDEAASLKAMVDSLVARAEHPSRIRIVVVDNGSQREETLALLADWRTGDVVEVLPADEPFNWSRLNNLAAANRPQDILVFANNDMEMLTSGWDVRLAACLRSPGVGASGARLLYPGGQIQHAGMALGALSDAPLHEGLGEGQDQNGPLARWTRNRPAAAVTGAFLAVRREVFNLVGGFDAFGLAIACNDIDFCLRVREQGLTVMYQADIELVHYESRTRGHADTNAKIAWASAEMGTVHRTWGEDFIRDPSRSAAWESRGVQVFHKVRTLDRDTVLAAVAARDHWAVRRS